MFPFMAARSPLPFTTASIGAIVCLVLLWGVPERSCDLLASENDACIDYLHAKVGKMERSRMVLR